MLLVMMMIVEAVAVVDTDALVCSYVCKFVCFRVFKKKCFCCFWLVVACVHLSLALLMERSVGTYMLVNLILTHSPSHRYTNVTHDRGVASPTPVTMRYVLTTTAPLRIRAEYHTQ